MKAYDILTTYVRENLAGYLAGLLLTSTASLLSVVVPWQLGLFADRFAKGALTPDDAATFALAIGAVCTLRAVLWWLGCDLILGKGRELIYQLRKRLLDSWTRMPARTCQGQGTGELVSHAMNDVEVVRELVSMELCMTVSGLSLLGSVICMMVIHGTWSLTLAALAPLLCIPLLVRMLAPALRRLSQRCQEALGAMAQLVEEVFSGIRTVKAFGTEGVVGGRFRQRVDEIVKEQMRLVRHSARFEALVPLLANLSFVIVLGYGAFLVATGGTGMGDLVAFTLYVAMLRNPLVHLGKSLNVLQRSSASLGRIARMLESEPLVEERSAGSDCPRLGGELHFDNLSFRYPGSSRDVLRNVSFFVAPGETVGIVGRVGSGKSTLTRLLLRLYDPPRGTLFVDGRDILDYPIDTVRRGISCASQESCLFSSTILENIAYSDDAVDRGRAEAAAKVADLHETVSGFPLGYATEAGEGGVRLSGGQKQRLSIARMVYRTSRIRILDDCMSALDAACEQRILRNLTAEDDEGGGEPRTTIIVSHRLSSVLHADQILVMEDGCIVEQGGHEELIAKNGQYAALWRIQEGRDAGGTAGNGAAIPERDAEGESSLPAVEALAPQPPCNAGVLRTLLSQLRQNRWSLALVALLITLVMAIEMVQPRLVQEVIDRHLTAPHHDVRALVPLLAAYVMTVLLACGLTYWQELAVRKTAVASVREIRLRLFGHLQRLGLRYFDRHTTGHLLTNVVSDTETLNSFFGQFLPANLRGLLSLGVITLFMLDLDVRIALSCLLLIPLIFLLSCYFRTRLRGINNQLRNHFSRMVSFLTESLRGMTVIQLFQQEQKHRRLFDDRNRALRDATERENRTSLLLTCATELTGDLGMATLVWFGGCSVSRGAVTFGVLYAFIGYIRRFCRPINSITQQAAMLQSSIVATERIGRTLAVEAEGDEGSLLSVQPGEGRICFDRVCFAYSHDRPVLDNVSLEMPPGSRTGLVGVSGAGKTTLASLLARFYEATEGAVLIDGMDIRSWPRETLRSMVGIVQQEVTLFGGSVMDNIRFFRKEIPEERVRQACRLIGAEPFILGLSHGYDTLIAERGCSLSAGERQLISLARVLVFDPRILILDEATASLDSKTEQVLQQAVQHVSLGRTLLIIAHRLSTIRGMDTIVVLDKGRVVESGAHDELMRRRGRYHHLFTSGAIAARQAV